MRDPDHTFVVLAYGESPFLRACLASLRAQTLHSRVVVATSTPSPFISETASELRIDVMINPERKSISSDWNFGLTATTSRFVTLAHQDDVYAPEFLSETLTAFAADKAALCFTGYDEVDDRGETKHSKISVVKHLLEACTLGSARNVRGAQLRAFLSLGNPLPCSSVTFDRDKIPAFRFGSEFSSNLDWDAWWRLMRDGETFARTPRRLVGRRHNDMTETSRHLKDGTRRREDLVMFRRLWPRPFSDVIALAYRAGY